MATEVLRLEMEGASVLDTSPSAHTVTPTDTANGSVALDSSTAAVGSKSARFQNFNGNDTYAKLLIHAASPIVDSAENGWTVTSNGGVAYSASYIVFDGTGDFLSVNSFSDGTFQDIGIDLWLKPDALSGTQNIVSFMSATGTTKVWYIQLIDDTLYFKYTRNGTTIITAGITIVLTSTADTHICFCRFGDNLYAFKGGVLQGVSTGEFSAGGPVNSTQILKIGRAANGVSLGNDYAGKMREIRISSANRWISDFPTRGYNYGPTPPLSFGVVPNGGVLEINNHADFDLAAADFEIEFRIKFSDTLSLPSIDESPVILSKGHQGDSERSFFIDFTSALVA